MTATNKGVFETEIARIQPNPFQPRQSLNESRLEELTESIREHGVIQPLIVTPARTGKGYVLIAGERRWRAAQRAGLKTVPVVVRENVDRRAMLEMALVENLERDDLNPIEEALAYRQLMDKFGLDSRGVAQRVSRCQKTVEDRLTWLELEPEIQDLAARGKLPCDARVSQALLAIPDRQARVRLAARLAYDGVRVKTIETAAARLIEQLEAKASSEKAPELGLARRRSGKEDPPPGQKISWQAIREATAAACAACEIKLTVLRKRVGEVLLRDMLRRLRKTGIDPYRRL